MTRIVITSPDGFTKVQTVTSIAALKQAFPRFSPTAAPTDAHFIAQGLPARISAETASPATSFGQTAADDDERQPDGTWLQTWSVQQITLAEAKSRLADLAVSTYWTKMQAVPSTSELTGAAGSYATVITDRETRFQPKLAQVRTDIQAASTVADAFAVFVQLRDLA